MTTSQSPIRFPVPRHTNPKVPVKKAEDFESIAQLIEDSIPNLKEKEKRQFYREVVQNYRRAAQEILRKALDDKGQDIAEYAVMLAVILVIVVGTMRLVGSNANTVFSQAASSIQ